MSSRSQEEKAEEYYNKRKEMNYYKAILDIVKSMRYNNILDVGARRSPVLEALPAGKERVSLDRIAVHAQPGIRHIVADFLKWMPDKKYDIVLCLQVLEHLDDPATFVKRLFQAGETVILSVPYRWKKGKCKYHVQDPVTLAKVVEWVGKKPAEYEIVEDNGMKRLICVY